MDDGRAVRSGQYSGALGRALRGATVSGDEPERPGQCGAVVQKAPTYRDLLLGPEKSWVPDPQKPSE